MKIMPYKNQNMKVIKTEFRSAESKVAVLQPTKDKLCITTKEGHLIIHKNEITHLIADSNYTTIYYGDKKVVYSQSLGIVLGKINLHKFIRIHKSYVLNVDYLRRIDTAFTYVVLDNGVQMTIARSQKQRLKDFIRRKFS